MFQIVFLQNPRKRYFGDKAAVKWNLLEMKVLYNHGRSVSECPSVPFGQKIWVRVSVALAWISIATDATRTLSHSGYLVKIKNWLVSNFFLAYFKKVYFPVRLCGLSNRCLLHSVPIKILRRLKYSSNFLWNNLAFDWFIFEATYAFSLFGRFY